MWSRIVSLIALALTLGVGCGTDDPTDKTQSCTGDIDCDPGFHCGADDKCVQECDPSSSEAQCPSGQTCSSLGRCQMGGECVVDGDCDSAPSDATCDGSTLVAYNQLGTCDTENGETVCNYTETRTTCEDGCLGGACIPDPCGELSCDTPPTPVCDSDGTTLVEFSGPGSCTEGVCQYQEAPTSCALGCQGGACAVGSCDSVTCNQPPEDECDDETAITYGATGMCVEINGRAVCDYNAMFDDCGYRKAACSNAACGPGVTQVGGVLVTEYMANPAGSFQDLAEWIEIVNTSGADIDLNSGWMLRSKGSGTTIEEHAFVDAPNFPAGSTMILAYSSAVPFDYDYNYDSVRLANNTDWFEIVNPAGEIADYVYYEGGAILDGRSRKLDPSAPQDVTANDDFANWCPSMGDVYDAGPPANYGTPGTANTPCTVDPCAGFVCETPSGYCNTRTNTAVQYIEQSVMCEESRFNNPFCNFDTMEIKCTDGVQLCAYGICETIPSNLPAVGELIISEVMPNPNSFDTDREWFEVYNTTDQPLAMFSMIFEDNELATSNNEYQFLDINLEVPPNGYKAFIRNTNPDENGGVVGAELYVGAHLKNNPDPADTNTPAEGMKLVLALMDGTVIDESYYDNPDDESQGFPSGLSIQLDPTKLDAVSNDDRANWCFTPAPDYGQGGAGTPGAPNPPCPGP